MKAARIVVLIVALAAGGAAALLINSSNSNEKTSAPTALSPIAQILPDGPESPQATQIGTLWLALCRPIEPSAAALDITTTLSRPSASASRPTDDA